MGAVTMAKTTLLVTLVKDCELTDTITHDCRDLIHANELVDSFTGNGYVGCVKVGENIKRVF
jgi:hypothetical protein